MKVYFARWRECFTLTDPVCLFLARVCLIGDHVIVIMLLLWIVQMARLMAMLS
jgi:hypothetical protein